MRKTRSFANNSRSYDNKSESGGLGTVGTATPTDKLQNIVSVADLTTILEDLQNNAPSEGTGSDTGSDVGSGSGSGTDLGSGCSRCKCKHNHYIDLPRVDGTRGALFGVSIPGFWFRFTKCTESS